MAIQWHLKTYLATKHGIFTATALQRVIVKKTGVMISLPNLCRYLKRKPLQLRLETMELLCTALNCPLSEFFAIVPKKLRPTCCTRKLSPDNTPKGKRHVDDFPDPANYDD